MARSFSPVAMAGQLTMIRRWDQRLGPGLRTLIISFYGPGPVPARLSCDIAQQVPALMDRQDQIGYEYNESQGVRCPDIERVPPHMEKFGDSHSASTSSRVHLLLRSR